jgi:hypothetical protein
MTLVAEIPLRMAEGAKTGPIWRRRAKKLAILAHTPPLQEWRTRVCTQASRAHPEGFPNREASAVATAILQSHSTKYWTPGTVTVTTAQ